MSILHELLAGISPPVLYLTRQKFEPARIDDIAVALTQELEKSPGLKELKPGMRIALTAGSRGVRNMALILKVIVSYLKSIELDPFIIPAMGSHGGAEAEGQRQVLESMGITEAYCEAPIYSSMEAVQIGTTEHGVPVFMDPYAFEADRVIAINRVKPHVGFRGPFESGVAKMLAIGLGKQRGAEACHASGFGNMARNIPEVAQVVIDTGKILLGIGILENAYDETMEFHVMEHDEILKQEPALLKKAMANMPQFYIDKLDILVVEEIGKNITGTGMDTNIIGRYHTPYIHGGPTINKVVVNRLTPESHGNANGIGLADFTTQAFFDSMSFEQTYPNSLTSTVQITVKVPLVLDDPVMALKGAIKTCGEQDVKKIRMAYVINTLHMEYVYYSEALLDEIKQDDRLEILSGPHRYEDIYGWKQFD